MARASERDDYEISGINVTPLVDIMLVLLVIFMVTTTYIAKEAISIELPRAVSAGEAPPASLLLTVTKTGQIFLDGVAVDEAALAQRIRATPGKREDVQAVIAADREAMHGAVVTVLDVLRSEGVVKLAIQIQRATK
jgi:biopolymer transport protein TolR